MYTTKHERSGIISKIATIFSLALPIAEYDIPKLQSFAEKFRPVQTNFFYLLHIGE